MARDWSLDADTCASLLGLPLAVADEVRNAPDEYALNEEGMQRVIDVLARYTQYFDQRPAGVTHDAAEVERALVEIARVADARGPAHASATPLDAFKPEPQPQTLPVRGITLEDIVASMRHASSPMPIQLYTWIPGTGEIALLHPVNPDPQPEAGA